LIVEIGGMAVVVVSLIVVVFELRQNTDALKGATVDAIFERQQFELYWSGEIAPIFVKAIQSPSQLSAAESWQLSEWFTAAISARQNEYLQYKLGLIDENIWLTTEGIIQLMFGFGWSKDWWDVYRDVPWDDEFKQRVDYLIETSTINYDGMLDKFSKFGSE